MSFALEPVEKCSRRELQQLQLERLRWSLGHAYEYVARYRQKFDAAGKRPADLRSLADLAKFPFTTKADLRDTYPFGMFAVPMEQVARILKDRPGRIVVRGHTDARPFRSEVYDNWRLSSARGQMASYMLVRDGVPDARLERIEGYADRQPRNPADPKAAENRRIEILLRARPE